MGPNSLMVVYVDPLGDLRLDYGGEGSQNKGSLGDILGSYVKTPLQVLLRSNGSSLSLAPPKICPST